MAKAVNIPYTVDEKGSFEDGATDTGAYTVPSLEIDLSKEPDRTRKRRFSVSAESNANDESDFDEELDDDSKSQHSHSHSGSHSRSHSNSLNNSNHHNNSHNHTNNNNTSNNIDHNNHTHHTHHSAQNGVLNEHSNNSHSSNNNTNNNNNNSNSGHHLDLKMRPKRKKHFIRKVYPKTKEAISRINQSVSDLFLWNGIDSEQQELLRNAMFEKTVTKGESIITQGDKGDYFYVIESGIYEVFKSEPLSKNNKYLLSEPKKVFEYDNKGSFGELALMYNAPRAATVRAKTDGTLWAVDRKTFRHIIVGSTARKRHKYDKFLKELKLLDSISDTIKSQMADILEGFEFRQNEIIIEQGSNDCEKFYLIQNGTADVIVKTSDGKKHRVSVLGDGDFFGERALLSNDNVRSATVIVTSKRFVCCAMDKASFIRLLGSLYDVFSKRIQSYKYKEHLEVSGHNDADSDLGSDQENDH